MRVGYLKRGIIAAAAFAALAAALAGAADTGAISGFVMDEDGHPLMGAVVEVIGKNLYATANADGYYVIEQVPVGTFDVKASCIDYGEQVRTGVKVIAGLRTNLSFQFRSGAAGTGIISGLVIDQYGRPVNRALVVVKGANRSAATNADGYYYIYVPVGTFAVNAMGIGYDDQVKSGVKVIAGLRTNVSFQLRPGGVDEEEEIEFHSVEDLITDIIARPPGIVHEDSDASTLDEDVRGDEVPQAGKGWEKDTGMISGLVTGEDGQPVDGALVWVMYMYYHTETNAGGYYSIQNVPPETFYVKALRVGSGERAVGRVNVYAGLRTTLSFHLGSGAPSEKEEKEEKEEKGEKGDIESRVVAEFADHPARPPGDNGYPAWVLDMRMRDSGVADAGVISGFVTDDDWRPLGFVSVVVTGTDLSAKTDTEGYYSIRKVPVGTFDVKASRVGRGEQVRTGVKVVAGLRTSTSFQLESKTTVTTSIQSEEPLTQSAETYTESMITGDEIKMQVVDDFADIFVRPSGDYMRDYSCPAWTLDRHIRYSSDADEGYISGFVTDEDGRPLSGASVVVTGADLSGTTDGDGHYHISDVPIGTFDAKASRVGYGEQVESGVKVAGGRTNLSFQLRSDVTVEPYVPSEEPVYSEE